MEVLIVEDDLNLTDSYVEILKELGIGFKICRNARQIKDMLDEKPEFKVAIIDINLQSEPLDGKTLLKMMRLEGFNFTPIIISGNISSRDISEFCDEKIKFVFRKPVNPELLTNAVRQILKENIHETLKI